MTPRHRLTIWHGEGFSVFSIVDTEAPEGDQPAVVASFRSRERAERRLAVLNNN